MFNLKSTLRVARPTLRAVSSVPSTSFSNSFPSATSFYSTKIEYINSPKAPKAVGPYSQAIKADGQIWVSGCLGLIPEVCV